MSVVVLAYHEMGCAGLRVLLERKVEVSAVFTYDDDPDENIWFGSVADAARKAGIDVYKIENINDPEWIGRLRRLAPDVIFSFYYRNIVGREVLSIPPHGCVNLHGSLLPKFRGRCPVNWQLIHGVEKSGVTLHYMVEKADAGDIIGQEVVVVGPDDTVLDLYRKLLGAAERLLERHLDGILSGMAPRVHQDESEATAFGGRRPEDGRIDWSRSAVEIHNLVRAVAPPWPGAFTDLPDGRMMINKTRLVVSPSEELNLIPGEIGKSGRHVFVGAGDGILELIDFKTPGDRELSSGEQIISDNR